MVLVNLFLKLEGSMLCLLQLHEKKSDQHILHNFSFVF